MIPGSGYVFDKVLCCEMYLCECPPEPFLTVKQLLWFQGELHASYYTKNVAAGVDPQRETGATTLSDGKGSDLSRVPLLSSPTGFVFLFSLNSYCPGSTLMLF